MIGTNQAPEKKEELQENKSLSRTVGLGKYANHLGTIYV
jgi:hypothetical protein